VWTKRRQAGVGRNRRYVAEPSSVGHALAEGVRAIRHPRSEDQPGDVYNPWTTAGVNLVIGHAAQAAFADARVDGWSDWFVTAAFAEQDRQLRLTFGHGSPFVFGRIQGGDPTFTFGAAPKALSGDAGNSTLAVSVGGRHYGLFGPSGARWQGLGTNQLTCRMNGKSYFSVALLPDGTEETRKRFEQYAHNHVVGHASPLGVRRRAKARSRSATNSSRAPAKARRRAPSLHSTRTRLDVACNR
jgi:endoglucanase Acf2